LRGLTATTLDTAFAKGEFDFVQEVSADFPINVLVKLLDVPEEDAPQLIDWGNRMIGFDDPEHADILINDPAGEKYRLVPFKSPAALEVFEYGDALAKERRGKDGIDLVSVLVNGDMSDGIPLTERDFHTNFLLLVVAGNETTRHTISHTMRNLIQNPDQLAILQEDPDLIPWAVEEFLRYASPVYHFRRTTTKDTEVGGVKIKAGQKVVPFFASGNRDEAVFDRGDVMDVRRFPNEHMTFGRGGAHMCLGNALARIELRVMFEDLIRRVDKVEITGEVDFLRSNFVHGIKRMPVKVTLR
jgi:cytochrome P450